MSYSYHGDFETLRCGDRTIGNRNLQPGAIRGIGDVREAAGHHGNPALALAKVAASVLLGHPSSLQTLLLQLFQAARTFLGLMGDLLFNSALTYRSQASSPQ